MLDHCIARHLADIGAVDLGDYIDGQSAPLQQEGEGNALTRLHQACQRAYRTTDPLKFEFIEQSGTTSEPISALATSTDTPVADKQCILTITKPDGVRRSYTTHPIFAKKTDAKLEAAKIAIDMGALDFLSDEVRHIGDLAHGSIETSSADNPSSDAMSVQSIAPESFVDDIEKCCLEWRAGRVTPHWVPFFDAKSPHSELPRPGS